MPSQRWQRPPAWLWPLAIAGQLASMAWLTSYTYFFTDDFLFLSQAQTEHFSKTYLREPLFEHFSPVLRSFNSLLMHVAPGSWTMAHAIQLTLYVAALAAIAWTLVTIIGNRWLALGLTVMFGQSIFLLRLLNWWTVTGNVLPSTVCCLVALTAYLRWRRSRRRGWFALSILAFAIALADYETPMLFPLFLLLVRLLVLDSSLDPRRWVAIVWRERWYWLAIAVLDAAALFNYYRYYYFAAPRPTAGQLVQFFRIASLDTFLPGLAGVRDPAVSAGAHSVGVTLAAAVTIAAIAAVLVLRPRAWRCLVVMAVMFVVTMLPIGLSRIVQFGVAVGGEPDYQQSVHYMFIVLTAFALSPEWGGEVRRGLPSWRPAAPAVAAAGALAVAVYAGLFMVSARAIVDAAAEPHRSRPFAANFFAGVDRVRAATGEDPVLLDATVPPDLMPVAFAPYNRYSRWFAVIHPALRLDEAVDTPYVVQDSGRLLPLRFTPAAVAGTGAGACAPAGRTALVMVPLPGPQPLARAGSGLPRGVLVRYTSPAPVPLLLHATIDGTDVIDPPIEHAWHRGSGAELAPVTLSGTATQLGFDLPGGACITSLALGDFSVGGPPI